MTCFRLLLLVVCGTLCLGGCATQPAKPTDPPHVSSMPWNTPAPGEGEGMMGSMINTR